MRIAKQLCALAAAVLCVSAAGCAGKDTGSSSGSTETEASSSAQTSAPVTTEPPAATTSPSGTVTTVSPSEEIPEPDEAEIRQNKMEELLGGLTDAVLENKVVRRMAEADISPLPDGDPSAAVELFGEKYGGSIEWVKVSHEERFTVLSSNILSGDSPDIFPTDGMDTFPIGAAKELFMPLDTLGAAEEHAHPYYDYKGSAYAVSVEELPKYVLAYSRSGISGDALPDPAELCDSGSWNRAMFEAMSGSFSGEIFLGGSDIAKALSEAGGAPLLTMENGKIVTNINDDTLVRTQEWIYQLGQNAAVRYGEADEKLSEGSMLFEVIPVRELLSGSRSFPENAGIVPIPSGGSEQYMPAFIHGYHLCSGAKNTEGAMRFVECERAALELSHSDLRGLFIRGKDPSEEETFAGFERCLSLAGEYPVFSCALGMPLAEFGAMADNAVSAVLPESGTAVQWHDTASEIRTQLDYAIRTANDPEPLGP